MYNWKHFNNIVPVFTQVNITGYDLNLRYTDKCIFRPLRLLVNGSAVDERREVEQIGSKRVTHLRHGEHDVDVLLDCVQVHVEQIGRGLLQAALLAVSARIFVHLLQVLRPLDVGNIPWVEDVVDILQHFVVDDLSVSH